MAHSHSPFRVVATEDWINLVFNYVEVVSARVFTDFDVYVGDAVAADWRCVYATNPSYFNKSGCDVMLS